MLPSDTLEESKLELGGLYRAHWNNYPGEQTSKFVLVVMVDGAKKVIELESCKCVSGVTYYTQVNESITYKFNYKSLWEFDE